jgi:tetratricopeptide (TPR) repeat protein
MKKGGSGAATVGFSLLPAAVRLIVLAAFFGLAAVGLAAFSGPGLFATPCPPVAEKMVKYATPDVRLYTDIGKVNATQVIQSIAFFDTYVDSFFRSYRVSCRKKNPIRCRLFASSRDFAEHRRKGDASPYAGAYFSGADNCIVASYDGGAKRSMQTLMHESAHIIQRRYIPNLVPWIDEGLACYFGATDFDAWRNPIGSCDSGRLEHLRSLVRKGGLIEWKKFFEIQRTQLDLDFRQGRLDVGTFYAQAWGVVFFYLHSPDEEVRDLFTEFVKGMNTGRARSKMILKDIGKREEEFREFVLGPGHNAIPAAYRSALSLDGKKKGKEALAALDTILNIDGKHVAALRLAGEIALRGGFFERSILYWERLAVVCPDATVCGWKTCRCLTGIGRRDLRGAEDGAGSVAAGKFSEAITCGEAVVRATRSRDGDALASLAMAFHASGNLKKALATMRKAARLDSEAKSEYKSLEKQYSQDLIRGK